MTALSSRIANRRRSSRIVWARSLILVDQRVMPGSFWTPCSGLPEPARSGVIFPVNSAGGIWSTDGSVTGVFERIFNALSEKADMEMAMIDGTIVKVPRNGQGSKSLLSLQATLAGQQETQSHPKRQVNGRLGHKILALPPLVVCMQTMRGQWRRLATVCDLC